MTNVRWTMLRRARWGRALIAVVILEAVMIATAFAWVAVYSHLLAAGESMAHYQSYARKASPLVSLIVGAPVFFVAAALLARSTGPTRALATVGVALVVYLSLDAVVIAALAEDQLYNWLLYLPNALVKAAAAFLGARWQTGRGRAAERLAA